MLGFKNGLAVISVSSLMLGATFFIKPDAARAEFTSKCQGIDIIDDRPGNVRLNVDTCYKRDTTTPLIPSSKELVISNRIGNNDGVLTWGGANFQRSCNGTIDKRYDSRRGTTYVRARDCRRNNGTFKDSELELDGFIEVAYDINGRPRLRYINNSAPAPLSGPNCIAIPGAPSLPSCK